MTNDVQSDDSQTLVTRREWLSVTGAVAGTALVGTSVTGSAAAQTENEPRINLGDNFYIDDVDGETLAITDASDGSVVMEYDATAGEWTLPAVNADVLNHKRVVSPGDSIQSAIDDLEAAHGGGTVELKAGTHEIDSPINFPDNAHITLTGQSWVATSIKATSTISRMIDLTTGGDLSWQASVRDVYLAGNSNATNGIETFNSASCTFENIIIKNCTQDGVVNKGDHTNLYRHVEAWDCGRHGWRLQGGHNRSALIHCRAVGNGSWGIWEKGVNATALIMFGGAIEANTTGGYYGYTEGSDYLRNPVLVGVHFETNGLDVKLGGPGNWCESPLLAFNAFTTDTAVEATRTRGLRGIGNFYSGSQVLALPNDNAGWGQLDPARTIVSTEVDNPENAAFAIDGIGVESANAETPQDNWQSGVWVNFTDTGDGSGTGFYLIDRSGSAQGPL